MRIDVVTGFPKLMHSPLNESIIKRAQAKGLVEIVLHDLRDFATDKHKTIDDTPYGGGAGMILKPDPVFACIESLQRERRYDEVLYLSADGERFTQTLANQLSLAANLILLCGHYKGIDERIRKALITREISIGDYVLTGGELPALVVIDALVRLVPGVLGDSESLLTDSFQSGLLDGPQYTRPAEFRGMNVPDVLLSGNHEEIAAWREQQQVKRTRERRKDLLET
ncbi:MAG: tRNA (guanosine(37)-N1)-methyltransferase TrmD [Ignavibacteriae bacterium]|nr:tRNA (guanosine(37)-N1)-methyltransferase TrmD [Ignavibacteriota bacterium]